MIVANLASKPRSNTRPVWVLTWAAVLIGLVLTAVNIRLFLSSNQTLDEQIVRRDMLQLQRDALAGEFSGHAAVLEQVPWQNLGARIQLVNEVLAEHRFSWSDLLDRLAEVLPWQVRVVTVSPLLGDEGVTLVLEAVSKDRDGFLELLDRMVTDPYFDDPRPSRETWPEGGQSSEYLFSMRVLYLPEGEGERCILVFFPGYGWRGSGFWPLYSVLRLWPSWSGRPLVQWDAGVKSKARSNT